MNFLSLQQLAVRPQDGFQVVAVELSIIMELQAPVVWAAAEMAVETMQECQP